MIRQLASNRAMLNLYEIEWKIKMACWLLFAEQLYIEYHVHIIDHIKKHTAPHIYGHYASP